MVRDRESEMKVFNKEMDPAEVDVPPRNLGLTPMIFFTAQNLHLSNDGCTDILFIITERNFIFVERFVLHRTFREILFRLNKCSVDYLTISFVRL